MDESDDDPLLRSGRLFAPWTWGSHWRPRNRWRLWAGAVVVAYLLSVGPAYYLLLAQPFPRMAHAYEVAYTPALWLAQRCPPLYGFYVAQWSWIDGHAPNRSYRDRAELEKSLNPARRF
ncbi:MAG: hypothetical protein SH850_14780 [Planctomycetaceae bacterium]|nr:hypothetical protein [Planctomycetaceae bacterium]